MPQIAGSAGRCRGFTLVEMAVSSSLLAAAILVFAQVLGWMAAERRSSASRSVATQEVANLMERIASADWSGGTPELAAKPKLSARASKLPGADLRVEVATPPADPAARRVTVELKYRNPAGELDRPARLVAWFHPARRAEP